MMTIRIEFAFAAQFTAQLVKEGLTFEARQEGDTVLFKLTGGY